MSQQFFIFVSFPNTVLLSCNISWKETKEVTQELAILSPNTPNWSRILFPLKRKLNLQKFNEPPAKASKDWVFWWRKMLKYHRRKLTESSSEDLLRMKQSKNDKDTHSVLSGNISLKTFLYNILTSQPAFLPTYSVLDCFLSMRTILIENQSTFYPLPSMHLRILMFN